MLSPIGNRIRVFDLHGGDSYTLPFEARSNICHIAVSPDQRLVVAVDVDGHAVFANLQRRVVLYRFNFKEKVGAIAFSPNGTRLAVGVARLTQVWEIPKLGVVTGDQAAVSDVSPFRLLHTHQGHSSPVTALSWKGDSALFLSGAQDGAVRVFSAEKIQGYVPVALTGNRTSIVGAYFNAAGTSIYTVSADGAVLVWGQGVFSAAEADLKTVGDDSKPTGFVLSGNTAADVAEGAIAKPDPALPMGLGFTAGTGSFAYHVMAKYFTSQTATGHVRVTCADFRPSTELLVLGFTNGVFSLHSMASNLGSECFTMVHSLSISSGRVGKAALNPSSSYIALGCPSKGQLLVWDWKAESYVLKQQGHAGVAGCMAYSKDGALLATGGVDGKVKVWNTTTGLCYVTFSEHRAPVTGICFAPNNKAVISSSLDGTVKAYDVIRMRCFRTMAHADGAQFTCVAIDSTGEIVVAGTADRFEVAVFALKTGELTDVLTGHAAPISAVAFSAAQTVSSLVTTSWDGSARVWDIFAHGGPVSSSVHIGSDVTALAFRPDGKEYAVATVNGTLVFVDADQNKIVGTTTVSRDLAPGRRQRDARAAANATHGRCVTALAYSPDSALLLAAGESRHALLYGTGAPAPRGVMLRRILLSRSRALDGVLTKLNSGDLSSMGVAGTELRLALDDADAEADARAGEANELPGARFGDSADRRVLPEIRAASVACSPSGTEFVISTPEGILTFSTEIGEIFDPLALVPELTPAACRQLIGEGMHAQAVALALRLDSAALVLEAVESCPVAKAAAVTNQLPKAEAERFFKWLARYIATTPHIELGLTWAIALLEARAVEMRRGAGSRALLIDLKRSLERRLAEVRGVMESAAYGAAVIAAQSGLPSVAELEQADKEAAEAMEAVAPVLGRTFAE